MRLYLTEVGRLLDAGELTCFVDAVMPFAQASDAYCGRVKGRRGRGKLVAKAHNVAAE